MILLEEEILKMVIGDHEDIEARGVGPDHLEEMEQWDQWDPLDQGDSREGMDYPPPGGPLTSTGLGIPPTFNANLSTIGMENSLHYLGESLNHVMQFQQNVNRNMVEHLNMTAKNQLLQGQALGRLVENTRQREFDKLFDSIPVYDGEDPEKFEPWLSKLESACLVGKRDVREVAICSSTGPVLEVLNSIEDKEDWATHRDELRRCFSTNKTRVHAADLLSNFRRQHANENLRSFIHQYTKMHRQATGLKPENDYDLSRKVEFMKRIRNTQIANKIIKSNHFKDYTRYSLQACFARALELEGDFQVGEVVTPNYVQAQVLAVEGEGATDMAAGDTNNDANPVGNQETTPTGMYNPNVCWRCGQVEHFARDCPTQDAQLTKALGRLHHTLEAETPIGRSLLNEFFNKLMQSERKQEIVKAKLKKARQQLNVQASPQQVQVGGVPQPPLLPKQCLHQRDPLQSHHHKLTYRKKRKWGDWLGLLSLNPCHQQQWQLWHQRKSHHLNLP